jgi:hypothetical protein
MHRGSDDNLFMTLDLDAVQVASATGYSSHCLMSSSNDIIE